MSEQLRSHVRRQATFWLIATLLFLGFIWLFNDVLLPFIAGMALAYFLDPVADLLERWGLSRLVATAIITLSFLIMFILALMILIPVLASQFSGLMERMPMLVGRLQSLIASTESTWLRDLIGVEGKTLQDNLNEILKQGAGFVSTILQQLWASGKSLLNIVSLMVVTPVVAFYMLHDWDKMIAKIDSWLPRKEQSTIRTIFSDIDKSVAGFIRGQGSLCLVLGLYYGLSLTIAGLNFGLLIGLIAGLISFIPYVGSLTGLVLALGVALVQFWPDYTAIAIIAGIFGLGQFLEGNILQPKMVGESVGLHPVWLMFALFAFGSLFGFVGMLIAVPAAAAVGVVVRFALGQYLDSEVYTSGMDALDDDE
ncbi:MAG: AI-2E family transporter [Salaquimonas sp.]